MPKNIDETYKWMLPGCTLKKFSSPIAVFQLPAFLALTPLPSWNDSRLRVSSVELTVHRDRKPLIIDEFEAPRR